jgi:hypothetical protein
MERSGITRYFIVLSGIQSFTYDYRESRERPRFEPGTSRYVSRIITVLYLLTKSRNDSNNQISRRSSAVYRSSESELLFCTLEKVANLRSLAHVNISDFDTTVKSLT